MKTILPSNLRDSACLIQCEGEAPIPGQIVSEFWLAEAMMSDPGSDESVGPFCLVRLDTAGTLVVCHAANIQIV